MSISNEYTGNGVQTLFSFTFPYISEDDIKVRFDEVEQSNTLWTFASATQIDFTTAPADGVAIEIYRDTNIETIPNTFYPGSAIRARDLNDNFTSTLYVIQEADKYSSDATDDSKQALLTAQAAETKADAAVVTANAAESKSDDALDAATNAQASSAQASADAAQAAIDAAAANSSALLAQTSASNAETAAENAALSAGAANDTAAEADSKATEALSTANAADAKADTAIADSAEALTTANTC